MKFRIITNGECYRAQRKALFWWVDLHHESPSKPFVYTNVRSAQHAINNYEVGSDQLWKELESREL